MKIESLDQDIRTLLSSGYYRIPRFQRPYSWDHDNVQDFWNDIVQDNPGDYFIGSMVVYKKGKQYFGVVDGQQRLTTITILLCVLRNALDNLGFKGMAKGVHSLIERHNIDNEQEFVLSTESSYPYFQDHIQKLGPPDTEVFPLREEDNLRNAHDQLTQLLSSVVDSVQGDPSLNDTDKRKRLEDKLKHIRDAVLDLKLIFVKLDNDDDAYLIFETLNTRGKDLSISDLVKNHLTKHLKAPNKGVDQPKIKWEKILDTIESSSAELDTDTFIHHQWLSQYDYLPVKSLFKTMKKKITAIRAGEFLSELVEDSKLYRMIHEPSFGKWSRQEKRIEESLEALMLFRVRQQTPCVLSLVREYKSGKIKKRHLEDALRAIEKFHFIFTSITSQRSSGGISAMYASLARRLTDAADTHSAVTVIHDLKSKLKERIPSLEEVKAA